MKRRIALVVSCILILLLMCGFVDSSTELNANSAFSGSRDMTLSFDIETIDSMFAGGVNDLERLIQSGLPSELSCKNLGVSDDGTAADFLFTLRFASLAEYASKIESITGESVSVDFQYDNNDFSRSTRLVESFETNELFGWLQEAFDELLGVSATSNSDIASRPDISWNDRGAVVTINNDTYTLSGGNIIVEDGTGTLTESVDIYTVINDDLSFARTVIIYFDPTIGGSAFASVCETVKSYMPDGAQFSYVDSNDERSCTIDFNASSAAQLAKYTSMLFGNTAASASVAPYEDDSLLLSSLTSFEESCSLATLSNGEALPFKYNVESYIGLPCEMYDTDSGESLSVSSDLSSNIIEYSGTSTDFSFRLVLESISTAQGIDYNLKVDSSNSLTREIKIYMLEGTDISVLEQIADYYSDKDASRAKVKVVSEKGQMPYISITISGNAAQLCNAENTLFGTSENRQLSYERQGGLFRIHPSSTLIDSYDISTLLSLTSVSTYSYTVHSNDTYVSYSVDAGYGVSTYELDKESSTIWQPTLVDGAMTFTFTGEYTNTIAILFICLLVVLLLLLAALAVSIFLVHDEDDEDENETPAQLPAATETPSLPEPRDLSSVFDESQEKPAALPVRKVEPTEPDTAKADAKPEAAEDTGDDILGIFTGISVTEVPDDKQDAPDKTDDQPSQEASPAPASAPVPETTATPEPKAEPAPQPAPSADSISEPVVSAQPKTRPTPYADYVERFPMEDLPPITPSPCDSVDEYSNRDFIEDLRYLGLLDDYKKRVSRVKVKVKKRPGGKTDDK